MLDEYEMDELIQPIISIYNQLELELLKEIAVRLATYDGVSGSLEWYLDKVNDMGILNEDAIKIIARYSNLSKQKIKEILEKAQYGNFDMEALRDAHQQKIIPLSPEKLLKNEIFKETLNNSYKEINQSFRLIQTKALESTKQRYMDVLNKSYIEVSSGIYDYNTAIRRALKQMANKGITGITYKRKNGAFVNYSIEAAVRRDTLTATHKLCNTNSMEEIKLLGAEYVEVSSHMGARVSKEDPIANHAGWQGKVYKLDGSDDQYDNFYEKTGYGDILGLGGVNCRHLFSAFFPGISKPASVKYDQEENEKHYKLTQKQRQYEREIRKLKKEKACLEEIGDEEGVKEVNKELRIKSKQLNEFCEKNGLKRDRNRENIVEQVLTESQNIIETEKTGKQVFYNEFEKDIPKFEIKDTENSLEFKEYTTEEIEKILYDNEDLLEKLNIPKSKWSGNVIFDDSENNNEQFGKLWSCDIKTSHITSKHILLHEQLHARSISYFDKKTYIEYRNSEEIAVQFLAQEISIKENIEILKGGYEPLIDKLREINDLAKLYDDNYIFALDLFNHKVDERSAWLESLIYDKMIKTNDIDKMSKVMDLFDAIGLE